MNRDLKGSLTGRVVWIWLSMPALLVAQVTFAQPWEGQELEPGQQPAPQQEPAPELQGEVEPERAQMPQDVEAPAERPRGLNAGDWTLSLGGNLLHDSPGRTSSFTRFDADLRLSWNYADDLRLTGLFGVKLTDPGMDEFNLKGRATYHLEVEDNPRFVPYFGGGLGFARLSNGRSETGPGFHGVGGIEFFLTPADTAGTSVFIEYSPEFLFFGGDIGTSFRNTVMAGLSFHW